MKDTHKPNSDMTTINCLVIDDEPLALTQLESYVRRVPYLHLVGSCRDAFEAMQQLTEKKVDALFIDINMPGLNGLEFVRSLTRPPLVVFTTAYSEYAIEGFKVEAVDYLLKPFGFQDLLQAAEKVRRRLDQSASIDNDFLFVKNDYRVNRVRLADIRYIEGMSEYVRIYIAGEQKPLMPLLSIKRLEEQLPAALFMRVHRSYIINLRHITEVSRSRIMLGDAQIPLGDNYREAFMNYVNSKLMR